MAHTIQTYRGRMKYFNDIDLLLITSLIIENIDEHQTSYHSLAQSARYWEGRLAGYAPGVIILDFDKELNEEAARRAFLSVLSKVQAKLVSFGDSIPVEFLRSLIKRGGNDTVIKFFKPGKTDQLLATVADLEELIGE